MPRTRHLQNALRKASPPEPVSIGEKRAGTVPQPKYGSISSANRRKFWPNDYSYYSQKLLQRFDEDRAAGKPHFTMGGKEDYFPWAAVTLLRPSAKMTPYQAQFQVPRKFNKLEFRDYLWNLYGLRALNITTQIKWSEWTRMRMSRFRTTQVKKMIIDMEQPFVWPKEDKEALESHRLSSTLAFRKFEAEMSEKRGSDLKKPAKTFAGVMGPYPDPPQSFAPQRVWRQMQNSHREAQQQQRKQTNLDLVKQYLKL